MIGSNVRYYRFISGLFYGLGAVALILAISLSAIIRPAMAQPPGECGVGYVFKVENPSVPYIYNSSHIITSLFIKAGNSCYQFTQDGSELCYSVSGLGTNTVIVDRIGSGPDCKEISHIEFYSKLTPTSPPPTATLTVTPDDPPTPTATFTVTPDDPPTPTATFTPTQPEDIPSPTPSYTPTGVVLTITPTPNEEETPTLTPSPQDTPGSTPTAATPESGSSPTPTPEGDSTPVPPTNTPPPTLPPPPAATQVGGRTLLVPVTGGDLTLRSGLLSPQIPGLLLNLGLGLLGIGLVFHGISNKLVRREDNEDQVQ
jgi:hypothetical protein